jgi:hypothetical protein
MQLTEEERRAGRAQVCVAKNNKRLLAIANSFFLTNPRPTIDQARSWLDKTMAQYAQESCAGYGSVLSCFNRHFF